VFEIAKNRRIPATMTHIDHAARTLASLTWRVVTLVVVGAVIVGLFAVRTEIPPRLVTAARSGRAVVNDDGGTIRVSVDVPASEAASALVLQDVRGRELMVVNLFQNQMISAQSTSEALVRFLGVTQPNGSVSLAAGTGQIRFGLLVRPDGSAELVVRDSSGQVVEEKAWPSKSTGDQ
jgi:hypothetical protein